MVLFGSIYSEFLLLNGDLQGDLNQINLIDMKTTSTFGIHFVLRSNKIIDGTAPIHARITVNTSRCEISIKRRIPVDNWNKGKGMAKGKSQEINMLNSYLEQIRSQLTNHYQDLVVNKQEVTPEAIKNKFFGVDESGETLKGFFSSDIDGFIPVAKTTISTVSLYLVFE